MSTGIATKLLLKALTDDVRKPEYRGNPNPLAGHCYVASEVAFHMLGGYDGPWVAHTVRHEGSTHWFLRNRDTDQILDITASQFKTPVPYHRSRGRGFLTKGPSARARVVIDRMWDALRP